MRLNKFYSIEECVDDKLLFKILDKMKDGDTINYKKIDNWTIQITDSDLSGDEEKSLLDKFNELCVYCEEEDSDTWLFNDDDEEYDSNY